MPLSFYIGVLITVLILSYFISLSESNIGGKKPLNNKAITYEYYLIDKEEYFINSTDLIEGLKNFHNETNIQLVIITSKESWSDKKVYELYYEMFNDEDHILYVIPTSIFSSTRYYTIGDNANTIVDDKAIKYLDDIVGSKRDGNVWKEKLKVFTNKLLSE